MECVHCKKTFSADAFDAHCQEHAEIQTRLKRSRGRTYGARYDSKDPDSQHLPSEAPAKQEQDSGSRISTNVGPSVRLGVEASQRNRNVLDGLDKRIHSIIESFPPYGGDGVETPWPETVDFKCKDCSFKFRTKSRPCGYRVEKEIERLDGRKDPSLFQCQKCSSMFPTEMEMEDHQKTHLLLPSRCLHCQKMFSTKYELDDHYEWHDDMDYRQRIDGLGINSTAHETERLKEPKDIQDNIGSLTSGIQKMPLPSQADKSRNQKLPNGLLGGISFISAEDIERFLAPNGYFQGPPTKLWHVDPHGTVVGEAEDIPWDLGPTITGHGIPGYLLVSDVAGRKRWMQRARVLGNRLGDLDEVKAKLKAAAAMVEKDKLRAMNSRIAALEMLDKLDMDCNEDLKFVTMVNITVLAHDLNMFEVGVEYNLRALELSVKQYSKDFINNFSRINNLAVLFDKQGMFKEAAYLYRRSLLGRIKIHGPNHADTLMSMQELANVTKKLGNLTAARSLLEQAYIGSENLEKPDEHFTMLTLNNLTTTYSLLGRKREAIALLESAIPRMQHSLGLCSMVTCFAICNLLQFTKGNAVAPEVLNIIRDMQEDITEPGSTAILNYGHFLTRNRRLGEAENLYRKLFDWMMASLGGSHKNTIQCLDCLACCLSSLRKVPEAEDAFRQLARLTSQLPENQQLYEKSMAMISNLSVKKDLLQAESMRWGLDKPGKCLCGKNTMRLCSCCQMRHFCSINCQNTSGEHKYCYPSVTPEQSISVAWKPMHIDGLEDTFREQFASDPNITGVWKLVSSEGFFINPTCFATFRVWKDPTKLVGYYFTSADTRRAFPNSGIDDWQTSQQMQMAHLYPSLKADPAYLLVAPGDTMFRSAKNEWTRTTGINADIDFPNSSMIDYLQSEKTKAMDMQLAVIIMVWET
ncbi:hypothetical protein V495_08405 [Pseudogymnoascus sp. VKM F-4514 (FW-929)]|nr:hypothetical protein V495_08405 [Pseudogymnoascus sp. VKM F-4514 (FW-929)]KFY54768.1 hypothetical protein V497_07426 [Pseudogymnoascus sp. VKM F-4516 (FW-969)]